jgi:predicted ester cyclase
MDELERHKRQVRRFYDEIWNRGDLAGLPEILTTDVVFRGSLGAELTGHAELAGYVREVTAALADYRCDIDSMVAEADRVVARMTFSAAIAARCSGSRRPDVGCRGRAPRSSRSPKAGSPTSGSSATCAGSPSS